MINCRKNHINQKLSSLARTLGIQLNFRFNINTVAINLLKSVGFEIIGEILDAIYYSKNGLTNEYIMYRKL